jgi:hypothetical protein
MAPRLTKFRVVYFAQKEEEDEEFFAWQCRFRSRSPQRRNVPLPQDALLDGCLSYAITVNMKVGGTLGNEASIVVRLLAKTHLELEVPLLKTMKVPTTTAMAHGTPFGFTVVYRHP